MHAGADRELMDAGRTGVVRWRVVRAAHVTLAHFELVGDELVEPAALRQIELPAAVAGREHLGLIISGRGPVWLYAYFAHRAHPFAWVATYDPRLNGAVVVQRHRADAPALGEVVSLPVGDGPAHRGPSVT